MKNLLLKTSHRCFFFLVVISTTVFSQLPANFNSNLVQSGYVDIMGVTFNSDGSQMFVWEKSGKVFVSSWNGAAYVKQANAVLDISDEVGDWRDFGLIQFLLDPDFDTNGLIYLYYMVDREHLINFGTPGYDPNDNDYYEASISRITRYALNIENSPLTTDYSSRTILLGETKETGVPLLHESHAGGSMVFGTDGTLLVTTGDNASYSTTDLGSVDHTYYAQALSDGILRTDENVGAFRSQMISSLCGKLLRLDPSTGDGLPSNPHYDGNNPRSAQSRMWGMGLRNPFRMSFKFGSGSSNAADGNPGTVFIADVGWNVWEDLHVADKAGLNFGWPLYEGLATLNSYYNSGLTNSDEVGNPTFASLCSQPSSWADDANAANRRLVHNRPEVAWRHGGSNDARVPWFDGTTPQDLQIGASGSPTTGNMFRGNTGVAGVYIVGNKMGAEYEGKYFFTDYVRNWIQSATLTDGSQNWFSDISEFASINFGNGIICIAQNPLNGYLYFANIYDGTLHIIYNENTLETDSNELIDVALYPNPAKNNITIEGLRKNGIMTIYTLKGQLLLKEDIVNRKTVYFDLSAGVYLVKIYSDNKFITKKLIID